MPIYEYYCTKCKDVFQMQRPIADYSKPAPCPACGSGSQRLISSFASKIDYNLQIPNKEPFRRLD